MGRDETRHREVPTMPATAASNAVTVREAVMDLIRQLGIEVVFGNPGSTELPFLGGWPNDIRYVLGLQEASVVAMADGYAQATGNAAFVNLHSAAGLGHALGNVFTAFRNQSPMVITAGQQVRDLLLLHPYLFAEAATEFPKPYVKWSCEPARAEAVPAALARAYYTAMQKPCGPTFVSIPIDDWSANTTQIKPRRVSRDVAPDPELLSRAGQALNASTRPVLVVGQEIEQDGAWDDLVALAEKSRAAVWIAPFASRACFPEDHPLFAGFLPAAPEPVSETLCSYDFILVLGAPVFTFHVPGICAVFHSSIPIFQITGDPVAAARAGAGTSILASMRLALPALLAMLEPTGRASPPPRPPALRPDASNPIKVEFLIHALAEIARESVLVEEAPSHRPALQKHWPMRTKGSFYTMASGGLGWSLPASVGIALANPSRRVTCLIGDGSAMYSIQGLWTAAQHQLPLTVVVLNNRGYGAMRAFSTVMKVTNVPGIDLPGLDFVKLAAGLGCPGVRVTDAKDLPATVRQATSARGPFLLEACVDPAVPHLYDPVADA
jgi:benzoylformate decarboxylase